VLHLLDNLAGTAACGGGRGFIRKSTKVVGKNKEERIENKE
jgi:hypothetical protein